MTVKNPTQWINPGGQGYVIDVGNLTFVDNLGNTIVDNTTNHNTLVTTPSQSTPKNLTTWADTGV